MSGDVLASTLASMTTFALATSCTPGPNNIMLTASGVNFGFARSTPHMAGVVAGFAVVLAAASSGLGLLFTTYPFAHTVLKFVGAIYLLWLAWKVANSGRSENSRDEQAQPMTFLQAAAFQWVNPKGVLTALSASALFVRPGSVATDMLAMLPVFIAACVLSVVLWTGFGTLVSSLLGSPRHARIFNVVMALLLVASIVPMVL